MSVQAYLCRLVNTVTPNEPEGALRPAITDVLLPETVQPSGAGTPAFSVRSAIGSAVAGQWVLTTVAGVRHQLAAGNADVYRLPDRALTGIRLGAINAAELQAMRVKAAAEGLPVNFDNQASYREQLDAMVAHYAPGLTLDDIDLDE